MVDPAMQAYVNRKTDNRFKKKVVFDRGDYDDLLGQIIGQIHEKKDRDLLERIKEKEDE